MEPASESPVGPEVAPLGPAMEPASAPADNAANVGRIPVIRSARLALTTRFPEDQEAVLKLASLPAALAKELRFMDSDGSGSIDVYELRKLAKLYKTDALSLRRAIAIAAGFAVLLIITLFSMFGLTVWAVALQKDMRVSSGNTLTALDGSVLRTASDSFSISAAGELIQLPASSSESASGDTSLVSLAIATSTAPLTLAMSDEQLFALKSLALSAAGKKLSLDVVGAFRDSDGSFTIATHLGSLRVNGDGIFFMEDGLSPLISDLGVSLNFSSAMVDGARARRLIDWEQYDNGFTSAVVIATLPATSSGCTDTLKACCGGRYQSEFQGTNYCTVCPLGKYKSGKNDKSTCSDVCLPGTFCPPGSAAPTECALGRYSNTSAAGSCMKCSAGTSTRRTGATSPAFCRPCSEGYVSNAGEACKPCAAGTAFAGNNTCIPCSTDPYYEWSAPGSSKCNQCPAGSYIIFAKNYTLDIDNGDSTSPSTISVTLPDVSSGAAGCALCPSGTYNSYLGFDSCAACPLGTFNNRTGATNASACVPCTSPNVTLAPGSSSCVRCLAGTVPLPGLTGCSGCPPGQFSNGSSAMALTCSNCTAGRYSPTSGATACTASPAGFFAPYDSNAEVLQCPSGTFSGNGSAICTACASGFASYINRRGCLACGKGLRALSDQSACVPCDKGSFSDTPNNADCTLAPPGRYVAAIGASDTAKCPAGSFSSNAGAARCNKCAAGTFASDRGSAICTQCASGTWSAKGSSSCTTASPGYFVPSTLDSAQPCAEGSFASMAGASNCTACPIGFFLNAPSAASQCTACALDTYAARVNATSCISWRVRSNWGSP